jgi:hypothetical protein
VLAAATAEEMEMEKLRKTTRRRASGGVKVGGKQGGR